MLISNSNDVRRGKVRFAAAIPALLALSQSAPALAQNCVRYEVSAILLGPYCSWYGYSPMYARGMSNHNAPWVAGFFTECAVGGEKSYVWTGSGPVQPLQFPGSGITTSYAYDVTDTGLVVGAYAGTSFSWRGFIYDIAAGTWTQLDPAIPNGGCVIRAANNAGMLCNSCCGTEPSSAPRWRHHW